MAAADRDRGDRVRGLLPGRRVPSGVLRPQPVPELLPGDHRAEGSQVSEDVRREAEGGGGALRGRRTIDDGRPGTEDRGPGGWRRGGGRGRGGCGGAGGFGGGVTPSWARGASGGPGLL